jgi:hypothetical protein
MKYVHGACSQAESLLWATERYLWEHFDLFGYTRMGHMTLSPPFPMYKCKISEVATKRKTSMFSALHNIDYMPLTRSKSHNC